MRLLHCARNTWEKGRLAGCFPTKAHRTLWSDSFLFDMELHSPRRATVHDVRDFCTETKKTGQALQSATYVKLTRRKAPASAPIRPVYDLPATDAIYQRFVGIDGSAYFVGGLDDDPDLQQYRRCPHLFWRRSRRQCRIFEIHPYGDLESVLSETTVTPADARFWRIRMVACEPGLSVRAASRVASPLSCPISLSPQ